MAEERSRAVDELELALAAVISHALRDALASGTGEELTIELRIRHDGDGRFTMSSQIMAAGIVDSITIVVGAD
jgi:hypothetical protein